jgi:hypothetical protein
LIAVLADISKFENREEIMYKLLAGLIAVAGVAAVNQAHASDVGIYAKVGSSGYGAGLGLKLTDSLRIRAEYSAFNFDPGDNSSTNIDTDYAEYSMQLDMRYGALLLDWHPFNGTFRITGGAVKNGTEISAKAVDGYIFVNNQIYFAPSLDLHAKADFPSTVPYLGVGWGDVAGSKGHFSFVADVGLLFQGSPDVKLSANCAATGANASACQQSVYYEEKRLQDEVDGYRYWPFLSVGVGYRF